MKLSSPINSFLLTPPKPFNIYFVLIIIVKTKYIDSCIRFLCNFSIYHTGFISLICQTWKKTKK